MRIVTAVTLSALIGAAGLSVVGGRAAAGGAITVTAPSDSFAVTVAEDLPAVTVSITVGTDAPAMAVVASLVSPSGVETPVAFQAVDDGGTTWTDTEVFDGDDPRGTWHITKYLVGSQDRFGWHAPMAAIGPDLSIVVVSPDVALPSVTESPTATATPSSSPGVSPTASLTASPSASPTASPSAGLVEATSDSAGPTGTAPPVVAETPVVDAPPPPLEVTPPVPPVVVPPAVTVTPPPGPASRPVPRAYDAAVARAGARNSRIALNLDARFRGQRLQVQVLHGRRWVVLGTVALNVRGDATLLVPSSRRALLRKGAYLKLLIAKKPVAATRLKT